MLGSHSSLIGVDKNIGKGFFFIGKAVERSARDQEVMDLNPVGAGLFILSVFPISLSVESFLTASQLI